MASLGPRIGALKDNFKFLLRIMSIKKANRDRISTKAFSLVEMMIALVVLAIVMGITINLIINLSKSVSKQQNIVLLESENEAMFIRLDRQLSDAFGWTSGAPDRFTFIRQNGDSAIVVWDKTDSMLYIDQSRQFPNGVKVVFFRFLFMPKKAEEIKIDQELWLKEADLDENGIIEGSELQGVTALKYEIKLAKGPSSFRDSKYLRLPPAIVEEQLLQ